MGSAYPFQLDTALVTLWPSHLGIGTPDIQTGWGWGLAEASGGLGFAQVVFGKSTVCHDARSLLPG